MEEKIKFEDFPKFREPELEKARRKVVESKAAEKIKKDW